MEEKKERKSYRVSKLIINIIFTIIMICLILFSIDMISISKYNKGPYFAIKINENIDYTEYYGVFYKVIKYNQKNGRNDMEIGNWKLKPTTSAIDLEDIDLAIEFQNDEVKAYKSYYKKFVRIYSSIKKIQKRNNIVVLGYDDEDNKYTLDIICEMNKDVSKYEKGKEIIVVGTVYNYKGNTTNSSKKLYVKNCIAVQ